MSVRVAALGPLAYSAGTSLLRPAARGMGVTKSVPGPFYPLDEDAAARVACYALVARGLRNTSTLPSAADNLKRADGTEAAWWLGFMGGKGCMGAVRALPILVEAVK